jgi:hypothetical protein
MYIGKTPTVGNFQKCDALTASATADYTLQVSSTNVVPESVNHMIVSLNGVIQAPTTAYTVSGSTLSFTSALTSNDTIDFVILLGNVLDIGTPSDDTVSTAKIQDDAVTSAKLGTGDMTFPNGDLIFGTAGKGVCLGVTSNTDANTLDDYEEGTWTPAYEGSSTAGTGVTGDGQYTKIGNLVHVDFGFVNVTTSGAAGDLRITGLPFTVSNATTRGSFAGNVRFYNHDLAGNTYYQLTPVADGNTTYIVISQTRDDGTWSLVQIENSAGLYIEGGITYTTTA